MNEKMKTLEFTLTAIVIGVVIALVMTAANVYLGLYAGMTVSASIPAAVLSMGFFKVFSRQKKTLLQSNIVQTIASAGSSIAAGVIFTLPALILVGAWKDFQFWPTTLIALAGGLLGVIFMIPVRRSLIVEDKTLKYPEGVACAAVLQSGAELENASQENAPSGMKKILAGLFIGGIFKFFVGGIKVFQGTIEKAFFGAGKVWYMGSDISPALVGVGYIVNLDVALIMFAGGVIGWLIGIPLLGLPGNLASGAPLDAAWALWAEQIRYLGVGAMIIGGLWSIVSVRDGIFRGVNELKKSYKQSGKETKKNTDIDMGLTPIFIIFIVCLVIMLALYNFLLASIGYSILTTIIMIFASFIFVAVSSYIVGLVGSSNNPVSGMTISALLVTAALFLVLGYKGDSAILATLGVAAIVCCAACSAGDMSQDLKTGYIVEATPKWQQYGGAIGVMASAFVVAPVLTLLHNAYGIGSGQLKAPQAALFASITNALFGKGNLPYTMVFLGMILGVIVIIIDTILKKRGSKIRLYLMPLAVGIYLPITLAIPIVFGGMVRFLIDRSRAPSAIEGNDSGVLFSSGLIAGESIMGVLLALVIYFKIDLSLSFIGQGLSSLLSLVAILALSVYLYFVSRK